MQSITDGSNTYSYKYNEDGIRTSKTVNGVTTNYKLQGNNIIFEQTNDNMIYYIYDASGNVIGLKYNDNIYYYEKNIQNDITGIMDDSFNLLAKYEYDSWGNILSIKDTNGNTITDSTNIALVNPFRYRSYYYDSEIDMYYLNSRYYNSEWGRFINADNISATANITNIYNKNLYSYTDNNPISRIDTQGDAWWGLAGAFFGFVGGGLSKIVSNAINGEQNLFDGFWSASLGGALTGFLLTTTFNPTLAYYAGAGVESIINEGGNYAMGTKKLTFNNAVNSLKVVAVNTFINGTIGAVTGEMAKGTIKTNDNWFTPIKFTTSFTGKYAKKVLGQNLVQGAYQIGGTKLFGPTTVYAPTKKSSSAALWCPAYR